MPSGRTSDIQMTRFSYFSGPAPIQMSTAFTFIKDDCDANSHGNSQSAVSLRFT